MFQHTSRHRRVIDQQGNAVDDTVRFPRLHAVGAMVRRRPDDEPTAEIAMHRPYRTSPSDLQGVGRMPFAQGDTLGMRRPQPPRQAPTIRQRVQDGFAAVGRELDGMVRVLSSGWRKLAAENEARMASLDERLDRLGRRVHGWAAEGDGRDLAAAHDAGGTEQVLRLTPQVLAEMDRRRKQMAA